MAYYSMDSLQDSCYEGTNVLINKFNIHDENKLDEIETIIVTSKSAEWVLLINIRTINRKLTKELS